jgi:hypothetical protein
LESIGDVKNIEFQMLEAAMASKWILSIEPTGEYEVV